MNTMIATFLRIPSPISQREHEVLELLSFGKSSLEVASKLRISNHPINDHPKAVKEKLGARNVPKMIRSRFKLQLLNHVNGRP